MASAIGSITAATAAGNTARLASLEQQLANYQGQLQQDETNATGVAGSSPAQAAASQVALVQSEIAQLGLGALASPQTTVAPAPTTVAAPGAISTTLGTTINVTA